MTPEAGFLGMQGMKTEGSARAAMGIKPPSLPSHRSRDALRVPPPNRKELHSPLLWACWDRETWTKRVPVSLTFLLHSDFSVLFAALFWVFTRLFSKPTPKIPHMLDSDNVCHSSYRRRNFFSGWLQTHLQVSFHYNFELQLFKQNIF